MLVRFVLITFATAACLQRIDPRTFENYASRIEYAEQVTSLGTDAESRVIAYGDSYAIFSREYESFAFHDIPSQRYVSTVLRRASRLKLQRNTPFLVGSVAYISASSGGPELAAGFEMDSKGLGNTVNVISAPHDVELTGVSCGDARGVVVLTQNPGEIWSVGFDSKVLAHFKLDDAADYLAMARLPNGIVLAVKDNGITAIDLDKQTSKRLSFNRETPLPKSTLAPFGAVAPYSESAAFVVENGQAIYTVSAETGDTLEITSVQQKAVQGRSLVYMPDRQLLVVGNGIGGMALFNAKVPEELLYLNHATIASALITQIALNPADNSVATSSIPVASVYKVFDPQ